jgi:hypothetical protein
MVTRHRIDRLLSIQEIKANPRNARTHSKVQTRQIAESIKAFGFGARPGGRNAYPDLWIRPLGCPILGLSEAQKRALALAADKSGDNAGWDRARLVIELPDLTNC